MQTLLFENRIVQTGLERFEFSAGCNFKFTFSRAVNPVGMKKGRSV